MVWSDESHSLLHNVDGRACMCPILGEELVPGCSVSVKLWEMIPCWESLGPVIHGDVTPTHTTYLNIVVNQVHSFKATILPNGNGLF